MHIQRRRRLTAIQLATILVASTLALVAGPLGSPASAAEPPSVTGEPCAPGVGVTVVVDYQNLGDVELGCAPGEQTNAFDALTNAGFTFNEDPGALGGTMCQIRQQPAAGYPTCWFNGFWSSSKSNGAEPWEYAQVGPAAGPLPIDSVEGWAWTDPIPADWVGLEPRIAVADLPSYLPKDCDAGPQLPTFDIIDDDEILPVTVSDGSAAKVAVLTDVAADPATAVYTEMDELPLTGLSGPVRVLAQRADTACPTAPTFDAVYDVRAAYAPRWSGTGDGAPSPAIDKASTDIVGWMTGHSEYTAGTNVNVGFQTPTNAYGPVTSSLVVLGDHGSITATFDAPITDGPGYDLAVFENGFASGVNDFLEVGYLEVSSDGTNFVRFDSASRRTTPVGSFTTQAPSELGGLPGKDLAGKGTPFDLAVLDNKPEVRSGAVNLDRITHVRLKDIVGDGSDLDSFGRPIYDPFPVTGSAGFDLTGMAVLNAFTGPEPCTVALSGAGGADAGLDWLACELQANGGTLPGFSPGTIEYGLTLDAIMAFALNGRADDPTAQAAYHLVADDLRSYVTDQNFGDGEERIAGALGKSLLATTLMGEDPSDVDGLDLEAEVRARMQTTGDQAGRFSDLSEFGDFSNGFGQTLSMMALANTDGGVPDAAVDFLLDQQCPNGGFRGSYTGSDGCTADTAADTDYTALSVQALAAAPRDLATNVAIADGTAWLLARQDSSGAIAGTGFAAGPNTNTTGLAAQALRATGRSTAADQAAAWVAQQQLITANAGTAGGELELGAIAYNAPAFADAVANGIEPSGRDQWRRSTPQALLAFAAPAFGGSDAHLTGDVFVPMAACRILDTRNTGGAYSNGETRPVTVAGSCGVPADASAVEASITAVAPSANGFLRAWPAGASAPQATFVNFTKNQGTTNTGAVSLGTNGVLTTKSFGGPSDYVIDVQGYYLDEDDVPAETVASVYVAISPCRIVDSREGLGVFTPGRTAAVAVTGAGAEFAAQGGRAGGCDLPDEATAVEASISAVSPSANGFLRAWPTGAPAPAATSLNYSKAQGTTNTGAIAVGAGRMSLKNFGGNTHFVVDVQGYFIERDQLPTGVVGSSFVAQSPCRVLDTRTTGGAFAVNETRTVAVAGSCGVPVGASAVEAAVSAVAPKADGFFRIWPAGTSAPQATFVTFTKNQGTTNTGSITVSDAGAVSARSYSGSSDYVVDVGGYFVPDAG